ncbi:hypothetical protein EUTSA_v10002770mg, partial [Eutrema salsugineum]
SDCRVWNYVSQDYKAKYMILRIIRSLGVVTDAELARIKIFEEEDLEGYLYRLLDGNKYFFFRRVGELERPLPGNHKRSRVIITTRIQTVAEGVNPRVYTHKNSEQGGEELERIGKDMVQKCGGPPLAIVVLAGIKSSKRPNEWNYVYASLWKHLKDYSIHISTLFDLSFKELQHELKLCFLYLSVFPEDFEINVEMLIQLFIAKRFIQKDGEIQMEDVARDYIEELIGRSLVEAVKRKRGSVNSCRIHDLHRDVAVKKAKEVNFVDLYTEQVF